MTPPVLFDVVTSTSLSVGPWCCTGTGRRCVGDGRHFGWHHSLFSVQLRHPPLLLPPPHAGGEGEGPQEEAPQEAQEEEEQEQEQAWRLLGGQGGASSLKSLRMTSMCNCRFDLGSSYITLALH